MAVIIINEFTMHMAKIFKESGSDSPFFCGIGIVAPCFFDPMMMQMVEKQMNEDKKSGDSKELYTT